MHTRHAKSKRAAFTLIELMIVVAIIGLLAAIAIPNLARARTTSQTNACINNLREIDGAKQSWGLENKNPSSTVPTSAQIQPYLGRGTGTLPFCPLDPAVQFSTSYNVNDMQSAPTCIISVNHIYN